MRVHKFAPYSRLLGREMPIALYGHFGVPIMVFPTAVQDFEEYERMGMLETLSPFLDSGMIKLYCVTSINGETWMNSDISPGERAWRQELYDRHIVEEVVPLVYADCQARLPLATIGSSFGAYNAANSILKHPDVFRWCIAMSGIYDMGRYFQGYSDDNCIRNNPVDFVAHLKNKEHLAALARTDINIICGQGPWERVEWSKALPAALGRRGIPHNFDLWGHDVAHDWPWWKIQLQLYIPRLFG